MHSIPKAAEPLVAALSTAFTRPTFQRVVILILGAILSLRRRTVTARCELPGLSPARADVILAGAVILETFLDLYKFPELLVSDRGLRYGVLVEAAAGL